MRTKYNIGQIVEVRAIGSGCQPYILKFEIKSITISEKEIRYFGDIGYKAGWAEDKIIRVRGYKNEGANI